MPARELRYHLLPLALVGAALVLETTSGTDLRLADWLYRLEGQHWALRNVWLTAGLLHEDAQLLLKLIALGLLAVAITSHWYAPLRAWERALWMLLVSMLSSVLLIGMAKHFTHVDCPWSLARYGGGKPYIPWWQPLPAGVTPGRCFPAAHAGAGYALLALYFFLRARAPALRWLGLAVGLATGLVFGITQQLRGAHFLSHDLVALALCWANALFWYWLIMGRDPGRSTPHSATRQ